MDRTTSGILKLVVGGALIGASLTYVLAEKKINAKYRAIAESEIESVKDSYNLLHKQGPYSDPKKAFEAMKTRVNELESYDGLLDENGYFKEEVLDAAEEESTPSRKPGTPDGRPDPEEVVKAIKDDRVPPRHEGTDTPYVIAVEEFFQDNPEYSKITVSYYEYDNTLASEDESIVRDHEKLLGGDFHNYIGWKADSDHVVYVRNERISSDFEVLVHEGGYEAEVLGILPDDHPKKKMLNVRNDE